MHATISCYLAQIVMNVYIYIYIIYLQNPVRTEWSWNMNVYKMYGASGKISYPNKLQPV